MDIVKLINNFKCPLINGIFFPNGDILVIENNNVSIRVVCKTTVESYFLYNSVDYVTKFEILVRNSNNKYTVGGGEGPWGGEGIILLEDNIGNLIWFLFMDNIDPIINITIIDDFIEAKNANNLIIRVPINTPQDIYIV